MFYARCGRTWTNHGTIIYLHMLDWSGRQYAILVITKMPVYVGAQEDDLFLFIAWLFLIVWYV